MNEGSDRKSCLEFQGQLAELIQSGIDVEHHPHLQSCELCRGLLRDIERIAKGAGRKGFGGDEITSA